MSEDTAFARIRVARTAWRFPAIFPALADGTLNMTAVLFLAPHLTPDVTTEWADELLSAAAGKTKEEIRLLLAQRLPQADVPTLLQAVATPGASDELALEPVVGSAHQLVPERVASSAAQLVPERVAPSVESPRAKLKPLSPGRFALQVTVDQETYEQLRYAQSLLGHAVPSGDVAKVLKRALDSLVEKLEQKKFARCVRSRPRRSSGNGQYVPAEIRSKVWHRDGGQCTFVSEKGKRCESRFRLEFDHVDPVARGGQTSADRMRLCCRAHNQYTAEYTFGAGFMRAKIEERQNRTAPTRKQALIQKQEQAQSEAAANARAQAAATAASDLIPWLRGLRFSAEEARRGAALCAHMPDAPLEERVRVALRGLAPNCVRRPAPVTS